LERKYFVKSGKEVLIKVVVQAHSQYAMSIFKILVSVCKAIEWTITNLWWQNNEKKKANSALEKLECTKTWQKGRWIRFLKPHFLQ